MRNLLLTIPCVTVLAACGIVYRQPIYQGNLINQEAVSQLHQGMSRQEVVSLLGTPAFVDPMQPQRWDYAASQRIGRLAHTQVRNFTVFFDNDHVSRWEGDYFPNQDEALARAANRQFGPNLVKSKQQ